MKYINKYKSPNYNSRNNSKIQLIIIHYTALKDITEALSYLCNKEKKVSSHYLISQNGTIYSLVQNKFRAWHAGQSYWQEMTDINSISLGIELDYNPHGKNNKFSFKMIFSLKKLLLKLQKKYKINKNNILAHSDVAPFRKKDPGIKFPWKSFSSANIILSINKLNKAEIKIIEDWLRNYNFKSKKQRMILALSIIGYDTRQVHNNNVFYNKLIQAYKIRHCVHKKIIKPQSVYYILMQHLFNFMLTKN
tara:strand:- start:64 stop:810 length:747 start_codon:yes stop_codon:yes gene_type:complete